MKRRVCVVLTARPSYARIKTALTAMKAHPDIELQLVVAASALLERYGNAIKHIESDGFKVDARVYMVLEGENLVTSAKSTGVGVAELATVFDNLQPHAVMTIADRYETLATAVAASYMNIPVIHIQGGEVTGSIDEKVRHAVTKLADLHFVSTEKAAENVRRMGERTDTVFVTGCPSVDLAAEVSASPSLDFDPFQRYGGVGADVNLNERFLIVMQHPVTTEYELARKQVEETLFAVRDSGIPSLWFWPNVDAGSDGTSTGIRAFREIHRPGNLHFFKNMTPEDFLKLVNRAAAVVGNSSLGIRECSFLGVPAVNIGSRQVGRERGGNVIDTVHERAAISEALAKQVAARRYSSDHLYGDGRAGDRIASLAASCELTIEKRLAY